MSGFLNDLRFGLRQLIKRPGFAAAAILTLALGIGANTAVFSVLNGYMLKPLPYPQSSQLAEVNESFPGAHMLFGRVSVMNYQDIKKVALGFAISSQLFNIAPFDPATLASVIVALSIITLAACYLPARARPSSIRRLRLWSNEQRQCMAD